SGAGDGRGETEGPGSVTRDGSSRVVEDDELLGEALAGPGVVVLAGELAGLAGDVGEPGSVVAEKGAAVGGGLPVVAAEGQVHPLVGGADEVGAEARALEVLPVDGQVLARAVDARAEPPEVVVLPGGGRRDPPRAEGAEVVREVASDDLVAVVAHLGADLVGIVPAVPDLPLAALAGLPAQVLLLHLGDAVGAVPQELGVPFGQAEFPGDAGTAERALAPVPSAVHRPVPRERGAVLA